MYSNVKFHVCAVVGPLFFFMTVMSRVVFSPLVWGGRVCPPSYLALCFVSNGQRKMGLRVYCTVIKFVPCVVKENALIVST